MVGLTLERFLSHVFPHTGAVDAGQGFGKVWRQSIVDPGLREHTFQEDEFVETMLPTHVNHIVSLIKMWSFLDKRDVKGYCGKEPETAQLRTVWGRWNGSPDSVDLICLLTMTMTEKSNICQMKAWPHRQECRGHDTTKKNLLCC